MAAQQFQGIEGLHTLADDIVDVLAGRQMIRHGDPEDLDGGDAANVQYLWRQMFRRLTLAVVEYNFNILSPVKSEIVVLRPLAEVVQFCIPGVDISSWDNNIRSSA